MRATAVVAALALAFCREALAVSVNVENGVYVLEESTFDTVIEKFPVVMVKFYAPWCGHCKAMKPDYEKAARKLKKLAEAEGTVENAGRLAKVDATVESNLAAKFGVQGFPTMIVFKGGEKFDDYRGGRDKDDLVSYMSSFSSPEPLGILLRVYYIIKSPYKDVVRQIPIIPPQYRKYLFQAFPLVLAYPFVLFGIISFCCCGSSSKGSKRKGRSAAGKASSKRPARSSSRNGAKKEGEEETKEGDAFGEKDTDQASKEAEPKGKQEKKQD